MALRPMVRRIVADAEAAGLTVFFDGSDVVVRRDRNHAVRISSNGTAIRLGQDLAVSTGMRSEREIRGVVGLARASWTRKG